MIKLYHFGRLFGVPDASPFCLKLLTYCRMAGVEYEPIRGPQHLRRAPKNKMPYIEHEGRVMGDSSLIIDYLKATFGDPLDGDLTQDQRHLALLIKRTLEDHLYWAIVYSRWADERFWPHLRQAVFGGVPGPLRPLIARKIRSQTLKQLWAQGVSRFDREDVYAMAEDDLDAVMAHLGQPYALGDCPTSMDATVYGFLANIVEVEMNTPLKTALQKHPAAAAYCTRMRQRYFPHP